MSVFEFVVSLYVVIAGLGVTLLVRSIGQLLEARRRIAFYWIHTSWLGFIFLLHVNSWFTLWDYRELTSWTVGQFLLLLSVPTLLYLVSHVAVPEISEGTERYDMREYYYERHRLLLGLLAVSVVFTIGNEYRLIGQEVLTTATAVRLGGLGLLIVGIVSARPAVHAGLVFAALAIIAWALGYVGHEIQGE